MAKKCKSRKKNGKRCDANAQSGKDVCVFHDPAKAADGERARRAGGISRSRPAAVLPPDTPDQPLSNTQDVATLMANSINRVLRGELDPKIGNTAGYMAGVLLNALDKGPVEERLSKLEAMLAPADEKVKEG